MQEGGDVKPSIIFHHLRRKESSAAFISGIFNARNMSPFNGSRML
jgi:hypothetical protein